MRYLVNKWTKRISALLLAGFAIFYSINIGTGYGNQSSSLGTNLALGSPILNSEFTAEDWNRWELVVWGIYLSNYVVPLVDDYNSAFNSESGIGSNGSGIKALVFGSGNDVQSNKVLKSLLESAIKIQQSSGYTPIYVDYSTINSKENYINYSQAAKGNPDGKGSNGLGLRDENTIDAGSGAEIGSAESDFENEKKLQQDEGNDSYGGSEARLKSIIPSFNWWNGSQKEDFRGSYGTTENRGSATETYTHLSSNGNATYNGLVNGDFSGGNTNALLINEGRLGTFYIKKNGKNTVVFDLTDPYDSQVLGACVTRVVTAWNEGDVFLEDGNREKYEAIWQTNPNLYLDCFGNIVAKYNHEGTERYVMVIPASANQHLTNTPKQNLLTSPILNGIAASSSSSETYVNYLRTINDYFGGLYNDQRDSTYGNIQVGSVFLSYDLDSLLLGEVVNNSLEYEKSGKGKDFKTFTEERFSGVSYGNYLLNLFNTSIEVGIIFHLK